jgi:hypothetical protein
MIGNLQQSKVYYQEKTVGDRTFVVFATSVEWDKPNPKINTTNHIMDADLFLDKSIKEIKGWKIGNFNNFYLTTKGYYKKFKENLW